MASTRLAGRFDQLHQTALGSGGSILVDQVFAGSLIDFLLSNLEFSLGLLVIARLYCVTDSTNLRPHVTLGGTIVKSTLFVLAKTLLGTCSVWHFCRTQSRVDCWIEVVFDVFQGRVVWRSVRHLSRVDLQSAKCNP